MICFKWFRWLGLIQRFIGEAYIYVLVFFFGLVQSDFPERSSGYSHWSVVFIHFVCVCPDLKFKI
jgi:hypothetical protein